MRRRRSTASRQPVRARPRRSSGRRSRPGCGCSCAPPWPSRGRSRRSAGSARSPRSSRASVQHVAREELVEDDDRQAPRRRPAPAVFGRRSSRSTGSSSAQTSGCLGASGVRRGHSADRLQLVVGRLSQVAAGPLCSLMTASRNGLAVDLARPLTPLLLEPRRKLVLLA